jgi:hypothetical protein
MKKILFIVLFAFLSLVIHDCTRQVAGTESGSETTNGHVLGTIVASNGSNGSNVLVQLLLSGYDPVRDKSGKTISKDTTDAFGNYVFNNVDSGTYTLQAVQLYNGTRCVVWDVQVNGDTVFVPKATVVTSGSIRVTLPASADTARGYVYIPGTTISCLVTSANSFILLDSVPAGLIASINYAASNSAVSSVLRYDIPVASQDTAVVQNPSWKYAKQCMLNTSGSGANVAGNVYEFPILVRLHSGNFDFSQSQADGKDLRFAKMDNTALSYEIERFDSASGLAEVWVKLDTVFGNNATQSFMMYWGNESASDASNGNAVFNSANGFSGVWHLAEDAPDTITNGLYKNSVQNANYGDDRVASTGKAGIIGKGQYFLKGDSLHNGDKIKVLSATAILKPPQVNLSAWVRVDKIDSRSSDIASMGDNYMLRINTLGRAKFVLYSLLDTVEIVCEDSVVNVADSAWHYVVGSFDGSEIRLYVDGSLRKTVMYTGIIPYNRGNNFVIGGHGYDRWGFDFTGNIDEVECASVIHSADWIRLCYMNQRNDALITFK